MSDEATLKDVTTAPANPPVTADTKEPPKADPAPVIAAVTDAEAAEIGRIMLDSGVTKDQVNEVLNAPAALASIRNLLTNNPQEFWNLLERTDPGAFEKNQEYLASDYVNRYAPKGSPTKADGVSSELMAEVNALKSEVTGLRSKEAQREQAAATAQVNARYQARVDDILSQDSVKALDLTKTEVKGMRALLDKELASDPSVVQRVSNGNFVDVPRKLQGILADWAADRKATAEAAKAAREGTQGKSFNEFTSGANPFMVDIPANAADSWDNTEEAFAKALTRTA